MNFINKSKFGSLSRLNKIELESPIPKHDSLKETLTTMHKNLTSLIKNLTKGENQVYKM